MFFDQYFTPADSAASIMACVALGEGQMSPHLQTIADRLNDIGYDGSMSLESVYRPSEGDFEDGFNASITKFKNLYS